MAEKRKKESESSNEGVDLIDYTDDEIEEEEDEEEIVEHTIFRKFNRQKQDSDNVVSRPKNPITLQLELISQHFRNLWSSPLSSSDEEVGVNENNVNKKIDLQSQSSSITSSQHLETEATGDSKTEEECKLQSSFDDEVEKDLENVRKELEKVARNEFEYRQKNVCSSVHIIRPHTIRLAAPLPDFMKQEQELTTKDDKEPSHKNDQHQILADVENDDKKKSDVETGT